MSSHSDDPRPEDEAGSPGFERSVASREPDPADFEPDFSPDPEEPPRLELWSAVGDVPPWGSVLVLLACGLVFAAQAARGQVGDSAALVAWGANLTGSRGLEAAWRWLASTFLHGGPVHLMWNSINLLMFGAAIEALYARPGFWIVYAGGGLAASAASLFMREWRGGASQSVGASGAIFALAGALVVSAIRLRTRLKPGRARALAAAMLFLVATSLAGGAEIATTDHAAHVAGLVAGALLGWIAPLSGRLAPPAAPGTIAPPARGAGPLGIAAGLLAAAALAAAFALAMARGIAAG